MSEVPLYLPHGWCIAVNVDGGDYRGTSLIRNSPPLGPYSRTMPWSYGGPTGGGLFLILMREVHL